MRRPTIAVSVSALLLLSFASTQPSARAQDHSKIVVSPSSIERPEDIGVRVHTNLILNIHADNSAPPPNAETPASMACVYRLVKTLVKGCPIPSTTALPNTGVGAIALVDAYDNPDAARDLQVFSDQFGLPAANFQQVYADGHRPKNDAGNWSLDEALDIEMAHAAAPNAMIFLVEAAANTWSDLMLAEDVAGKLVAANGGGVVSNSWTSTEWQGETQFDSHFKVSGVIYVASSGDKGFGVGYPAVSPFVVSAGGTSVNRSRNGDFRSETYWNGCNGGGGGGISAVYSRPSYQNVIQKLVGDHRGVPDLSADASPCTGPAMYDADGGYGWFQIGGTSASAPYLAGIINGAGKLRKSTNAELTRIYRDYANQRAYKKEFRDITSGASECQMGWDICAGVGAPITYVGK